jgi:HSP20 family molecular chaperone IbpA
MNRISHPAAFDEFFNDYFGKVLFVPPYACPGETALTIRIDVKEIDGETVCLRAEVKRESEENTGEKTIYSERSYGYVARSFGLPAEVNDAAVRAEYQNGVLRLTLPKKALAASRRVAVS